MFETTCIELSSYSNVFAFDTDIFHKKILPYLDIYSKSNHPLRQRVQDTLTNASKFYPTPQNIEMFTDFCIQLHIQPEDLNFQNFTKIKKRIVNHLYNRSEFNILDIIKHEIKGVDYTFENINDNVWFADAPQSRGHDKIGSGEILFSFFCGGCKPEKGDVAVDCVVPLKFELKGKRGRLLETDKILISDLYKNELLKHDLTQESILYTIFVITGVITSEEGIMLLNKNSIENPSFVKYRNDVINALVAINGVSESEMFKQALTKRWPRNFKSSIRALCGALQLTIYKKTLGFDYIILTDNAKPYMCKGFSVVDNVLANTLTLLHNDINIQQSLDGKGYQIGFDH